ncbi:putative nucleotidyltransferase, Ribonuclease H [Lupinus albus]|uniref:Putative nucleotidyltransferase, Ribonuclease H n=1 Tax=Lupinus albus TaxID=3870 RepID=A0A6A4R819_LUPAL|nr:putative nucleotidyltransferase, Ribonuclease H [Lupinus albus]
MQVLLEEGEGLLLQYDTQPDSQSQIPQELEGILQEFQHVFREIDGLPPRRAHDHAIHLKEGAETPHIRPYRCPHYQKAEIEKLVAEMLVAGVIRPNISPYSSPIILVKKKDGG